MCIMYIYNRRTHTHSTHTHTRTHIRTHTPLLFFKNTRDFTKKNTKPARLKPIHANMFKGLFTRPEEEERVDRDALRGERIERESDDSPVVVVVAAAEQPDEEEKQEKTTTSIELFLSKNKDVSAMKTERDDQAGIMLWINVAIFCFLLFSPIIALIPTMSNAAFMVIELSLIILIGWSKIEYAHRATVWNVCLARGIIVDFPKTHKAIMWLRQMPMYFAYLFLFLHAFTVYLTLDPNLEKGELSDILQATLSILAVLFVLLMTKEFVVIEGANSLLTLNMVVYLFQDEHLLREKGFRVVHMSRLESFVKGRSNNFGREKTGHFSWNEIHRDIESGETEEYKVRGLSLICGTRCARFFWPFRDLDA